MTTEQKWQEDYHWIEAFGFGRDVRTATNCSNAPVLIDDVIDVLHVSAGENDELPWRMVGKLRDGRYFFLDAWCDYTGWDCQSGGDVQVADTFDNLVRFGMTQAARDQFNLKIE